MRLKLELTVRDLWLAPDRKIAIQFGADSRIESTIYAPPTNEQEKGHKPENAFCTTEGEFPLSQEVNSVLDAIEQDALIEAEGDLEGALRPNWAMRYSGPAEGNLIHLPSRSDCPRAFRDFLDESQQELRRCANAAINATRWRLSILGPHDPINSCGLFWTRDREFWHPCPSDTGARLMRMRSQLSPAKTELEDITSVALNAPEEPLHHEVFREAWQQVHSNPRSALVIGIAAAEIGTKHCIGELVPEAGWLAMEIQTPPLNRILKRYLPTLPTRERFLPLPKTILRNLEEGIELRNKLAHSRKKAPSSETVLRILESVKDLLHYLDYYCGHSWALEHLGVDSRPATPS